MEFSTYLAILNKPNVIYGLGLGLDMAATCMKDRNLKKES